LYENICLTPHDAPEIAIDEFETFATGLDHPECLAFDPEGALWAGGEAGQVYRISPDRAIDTITTLGGFSGGVAWSHDNDLWVCNPLHGIVRVQPSGDWSVFANGLICPNFGLFDSSGNYYVTDAGNWKKRNGRLLRFAPNGEHDVLLDKFGYASGLALSTDEQTLFVVESDTNRVFAVDLGDDSAELYAENVGRLPNGLAFDEDGELYACCYASDEIRRIAPDGRSTLFACDPWAIQLCRPANLTFRNGYVYVANLGRTTITRASVERHGR
jgi:gluconolactonase